VIGGGKFANGAAQAGFGYLFNALSKQLARKGYSELDSKYVVRYDKIPGTDDFEFTVYRADKEFLELAERVGAGGGAKLRDWEVGNFGPGGFKPKHGLTVMPDLPEAALKKLGALMTDAAKARGMSIGSFVKGVPTFLNNSGFKATMISWGVVEMYNDNLSIVRHCQVAPKSEACQ